MLNRLFFSSKQELKCSCAVQITITTAAWVTDSMRNCRRINLVWQPRIYFMAMIEWFVFDSTICCSVACWSNDFNFCKTITAKRKKKKKSVNTSSVSLIRFVICSPGSPPFPFLNDKYRRPPTGESSVIFAMCSNSAFLARTQATWGDTTVGPLSPRVCPGDANWAGLIDPWSQISWSKPSEVLRCAPDAAGFFFFFFLNFFLKKNVLFFELKKKLSMIEL